MATLQVKHLPDELHAALRERADREHTTLSELVTRLLRRELALPSMADWLGEVDAAPPLGEDVDIAALMDDVRSGARPGAESRPGPEPRPGRRARR